VFDRNKEQLQQPSEIEKELLLLFPQPNELVIFDIGACGAEDSIKYSRLFPDATIFSFEPLPENVQLAKKNLADYNIQNVHLINKALSDKNGTFDFFVSSGRPMDAPDDDWDYGNKSSSLLPPDKHTEVVNFIQFNNTISVNSTTLDEFCKNNRIDRIDFIHMDVQGAELMVLKGAVASLNFIKAIWLEVSTIHLYREQALADDIEKFMRKNGFVMVKDCLYGVSGDRMYVSKKFFPHHRKLFPVWTRRKTFLRRVLRKAGF
jgi:FkbM family methyltransferase